MCAFASHARRASLPACSTLSPYNSSGIKWQETKDQKWLLDAFDSRSSLVYLQLALDWLAGWRESHHLYNDYSKEASQKTLSLFAQLRQMAASNNISLCRFQHLWWRWKFKVRVTPPWDTYIYKSCEKEIKSILQWAYEYSVSQQQSLRPPRNTTENQCKLD